jgi:hypothetical protein
MVTQIDNLDDHNDHNNHFDFGPQLKRCPFAGLIWYLL